ncbi:MAG: Zn-dependent hydrolase [Gemmatimonadales bacterium]|nr:Zn-dependent hydrolase [Gemmatimonadales bacterium]MYG50039.1 Zn-dependent hydrolase [Gemmatimonadales bacterium]MYK02191.1 Zn-dependent hydrolase [Candidatus Palauibacter ramosifaciens]
MGGFRTVTPVSELRVNGARLWGRLEEMARIGATPAGGVHRLALSDEDRRARDLFGAWAEALGLTVSVDGIGNMFARREGTGGAEDDGRPPLVLGSHLDSQPTGGRFDGPLGVVAALEVVETLEEHGVRTARPIEVANWTNEEGARFPPAMMGSGVFSGRFELADALGAGDGDGVTVSDAIDRIGYRGALPVGGRSIAAALELHIEQGPILEEHGCEIGVVTGVQGARWFDLAIVGEEAHAGSTPMSRRTDPVAALGRFLVDAYRRIERDFAPHGRLTFGVLAAEPASRNTVPGRVTVSVDLRHPDDSTLDEMERALREEASHACLESGASWRLDDVWRSPPVRFSGRCIDAVGAAADLCGYSSMPILAGAGHDSVHTNDVAPTGMIFVPCEGGISHNEAENITPAQAEAGANVLLHAALRLVDAPSADMLSAPKNQPV